MVKIAFAKSSKVLSDGKLFLETNEILPACCAKSNHLWNISSALKKKMENEMCFCRRNLRILWTGQMRNEDVLIWKAMTKKLPLTTRKKKLNFFEHIIKKKSFTGRNMRSRGNLRVNYLTHLIKWMAEQVLRKELANKQALGKVLGERKLWRVTNTQKDIAQTSVQLQISKCTNVGIILRKIPRHKQQFLNVYK